MLHLHVVEQEVEHQHVVEQEVKHQHLDKAVVVGGAAASNVDTFLSCDDQDQQHQLPPFSPQRAIGLHLNGPLFRQCMVTALEFFLLFFTENIIGDIVKPTNTYP